MTWKMPKIISASGSYLNLGNPGAPTGYTIGQDIIDHVFRHSVSTTVVAHDARGISKVEMEYYCTRYKVGETGGTVIHIWGIMVGWPDPIQNLSLISTDTYSANFYVGDATAPSGGASYFVLKPNIKPKITVTDSDGNTITQQLNW
jgi:hypothetical protein